MTCARRRPVVVAERNVTPMGDTHMTRQNGKAPRAPKTNTRAVEAAPKKASAKPAAKKASAKPRAASTAVDTTVSAALASPQPTHGTTQHLLVVRGGHVVSLVLDGGPGLVPWTGPLDARLPLFVTWLMDAPGLARPDVQLQSVTLHARVGGVDLPTVLMSDDERHQGELVRLPTRLELPADAAGELEYWFEVVTTSGETLWHSNFGRNFRLPLASGAAAVEQLSAMLDSATELAAPASLRS